MLLLKRDEEVHSKFHKIAQNMTHLITRNNYSEIFTKASRSKNNKPITGWLLRKEKETKFIFIYFNSSGKYFFGLIIINYETTSHL